MYASLTHYVIPARHVFAFPLKQGYPLEGMSLCEDVLQVLILFLWLFLLGLFLHECC